MAVLTPYKGLDVVEGASGAGGAALTDNFKELADRAPYEAASDPGVNDDSGDGFAGGDRWLNTSTQTMWACISASPGAAVWKSIYVRSSSELELIPEESGDSVHIAGSLTLSTDLAITEGGTGASSAATARSNLTVPEAPTTSGTVEASKALVPDANKDLSGLRHLVAETLTARQSGGTPGTDDVVISHNGTDAIIEPKSGDLLLGTAATQVVHVGNSANSSAVYLGGSNFAGMLGFGSTGVKLRAVNADVALLHATRIVTQSTCQRAWSNSSTIPGTPDLGMGRLGAGIAELNAGTAGNADGTLTLSTTKSLDATGTNVGGSNLTIAPGKSTGNATPATVKLQGTAAGSSGSSLQTLSDVLTITNSALATLSSGVSLAWGSALLAIKRTADGILGIVGASGTAGGTIASVPYSVSVSSTQNDWNPGYVAHTYRLTHTGSAEITGISLSQVDGQWIQLVQTGSGTTQFNNEDTNSAAANRIIIADGASDFTLSQNGRATGFYDGTTQRWRLFPQYSST